MLLDIRTQRLSDQQIKATVKARTTVLATIHWVGGQERNSAVAAALERLIRFQRGPRLR